MGQAQLKMVQFVGQSARRFPRHLPVAVPETPYVTRSQHWKPLQNQHPGTRLIIRRSWVRIPEGHACNTHHLSVDFFNYILATWPVPSPGTILYSVN
jgi:hypothetical protein